MAQHCAHCRSVNTAALAASYQCFDCGGHSSYAGEALAGGRNTDVVARPNTSAAAPAPAPEPESEKPKRRSRRKAS